MTRLAIACAAAVALLVLARRSRLSDGGPAPTPEPDEGLYVPMAAWPVDAVSTRIARLHVAAVDGGSWVVKSPLVGTSTLPAWDPIWVSHTTTSRN